MSESYEPDNLLDRRSDAATLQVHYDQEQRRERALLGRRLGLAGGDVLSVGCGWHPGRHLFPRPAWRMTGVDLNPAMISHGLESGSLDSGVEGRAGELSFELESFDVVLYRLVLHRVDGLGSRPRLARFGHTLLLIARRYSTIGMPRSRSTDGSPATVQPSRS